MHSLRRLTSLTGQLSPARSFSMSTTTLAPTPPSPTFKVTPPPPHPLGAGKHVRTAACLIIGDEVLNGKTQDTNSHFLAGLLFDCGIELKRIEVVADDEEEIVEAARRMVKNYDLVVSSGGIGPTHDDITYQSLAKAFDTEGTLSYDDETLLRMQHLSKRKPSAAPQTPEQDLAKRRMALFPSLHSEILFVKEDLWVPVVRLQGRLCVLPGVPTLFKRLAEGLVGGGYVPLPPASEKPYRYLIHTTLPESSIAPYLTSLADRVKAEGIRVGSYPTFMGGVTVSLIGKDTTRLEVLESEVVKEVQGEKVEKGKLGEEKQCL